MRTLNADAFDRRLRNGYDGRLGGVRSRRRGAIGDGSTVTVVAMVMSVVSFLGERGTRGQETDHGDTHGDNEGRSG